jgi:hypothetical protein
MTWRAARCIIVCKNVKGELKRFHVLLFLHLFIAFVMNYIVVQQSDVCYM